MMKIGYIGFSEVMLKYLIRCQEFSVYIFLCERKRFSRRLYEICEKYEIKYHLIDNKEDLNKYVTQENVKNFIMYECGMIIPEEILRKVTIINIHSGSLENNRGRTPIVHSLLRGDFYTKMSVYELCAGGVDSGKEICSSFLIIEKEDDSKSVKDKLEHSIPELLKKIKKYLEKGECCPQPGLYCNRIHAEDYTIDIHRDTLQSVERKIKSQSLYEGAILQGQHITKLAIIGYQWSLVDDNEHELIYEIKAKVKLTKRK